MTTAGVDGELDARRPDDATRPVTTRLGAIGALAGVALGTLYVLNPTAGLVELLPDNLPFLGNLDEAGAAGLVIYGLQYLGRRRRERRVVG